MCKCVTKGGSRCEHHEHNFFSVCCFFVDAGADVNKANNGFTALDISKFHEHEKCLSALQTVTKT